MSVADFERNVSEWGQKGVPFLFMIDFEIEKPVAIPLADIQKEAILFNINGKTNADACKNVNVDTTLLKYPEAAHVYKEKFNKVYDHLTGGDSYLTNLTVKTPVTISTSLEELFHVSKAKYKLLYNIGRQSITNQQESGIKNPESRIQNFLVFSPETFIRIKNGKIFSYPMKGTIDATIPDAAAKLLQNQKELAEHVTIVDLIRNDLSQVASNVSVTRFRYIEEIRSKENRLLQMSSEICGNLHKNIGLGTLLLKLLPAGSISGAPKKKTVEIIQSAEGEKRGYYTGIVGLFDGESLDSGVMIRYIEQTGGNFFYRSGGGITTQSSWSEEYKEVLDKIYVPVD